MTSPAQPRERMRLARDVTVGLLSSILATWVLAAFSGLQLPWALVAGLSLLAVVQAYILTAHRTPVAPRELEAVGLMKIRLQDKVPAETVVARASHSLFFWGISAKRTASSPPVRDAIIRIAKAGGDVRFLVMDPDSPFVEERAREEGESPEAWRADIHATIERLKEFSTRERVVIHIRTVSELPVWRMLIIDRTLLYVNYFLPSMQGPQSPQLEVVVVENGLAWPLLRAFEASWKRGTNAA